MSPRRRWYAAAPLLGAALLSAALLLSGRDDLRVSAPLVTVLWVLGLVTTVPLVAGLVAEQRFRRRQDKILVDAQERARAEHRRFLDRLDHELKNPLTAIRAGLAAHGVDDAPHLVAAEAQAARMGDLVTELRKLSNLETRPLEAELVDLRLVADEAARSVREQLAVTGRHRHLDVQFPQAPWQVPPVWGDPDLLYLAVFNLLSNAAKFTSDEESVEVRAYEDDGFVVFEVADTGAGIPSAEVGAVWDELARATNARGIPGSGLGLPLVAVVAARHGGWVRLESREGQGTRVRIALPARAAAQP